MFNICECMFEFDFESVPNNGLTVENVTFNTDRQLKSIINIFISMKSLHMLHLRSKMLSYI